MAMIKLSSSLNYFWRKTNVTKSRLLLGTLQYSTIFALSSGQGKCGVAVVRVSGPQAAFVLQKIAGLQNIIPERKALLRKLKHPNTGDIIDRGIVLWFPKPRSFTGEDTCELHVHGGRAVVSAILGALGQMPGCRPAQPGEFTRQAFLAGKLDLTEVEGLADLLQAETEAQRRQALLQLEGHLGALYTQWKTQLAKCMAYVEAYIDFSEDDNIEEGILDQVRFQITSLLKEIKDHLADGRRGEMLRSGVQASIIGQPNVGKSSLLNALVQRPAAIVTPHAGTTRDVVQLSLDLGGYPIQLSDTAGLRESRDEVEKEGIKRARSMASLADLVIIVAEAPKALAEGVSELPSFLQKYLQECKLEINWPDCLIVLNKADLIAPSSTNLLGNELPSNVILMSCETEEGFPNLLSHLQRKLSELCGEPKRECPSLTQSRHRSHLEGCCSYLSKFLASVQEDEDLVLSAEQLRQALRHLGLLTGQVSSEDLLDVIFSDFCIGK